MVKKDNRSLNSLEHVEILELLKRKVYWVTGILGAVATALSWIMEDYAHEGYGFGGLVYPALICLCLVFSYVVSYRRVPLAPIETIGFTIGSLLLLGKLWYSLEEISEQDVNLLLFLRQYTDFAVWFYVVYVSGFLIFDARRSLTFSLLLYSVTVALGGVYMIPELEAGRQLRDFSMMIDFYLSSAGIIALLYPFIRVKEQVAYTDFLMGIWNRRRLYQLMRQEWDKARVFGKPFGLLMFDLDHFKKINDHYGHQTGDTVLREVARVVQKQLDKQTSMGRWGGEEVIVVASGYELSEARLLAERLRHAIETHSFEQAGRVTVSIGVAVYNKGDTLETLIHRTDEALYQAKANGRNRVEYLV